MVTDPREEFGWLSGDGPLGDIYCVSFIRDLSPAEVLTRLGAEPDSIGKVTSGTTTHLPWSRCRTR
nr:DUF6461 domain-containing protein [Streptosporangium subroseum]